MTYLIVYENFTLGRAPFFHEKHCLEVRDRSFRKNSSNNILDTKYIQKPKFNIDKEVKAITQQFGIRIEKEKLVAEINNYLINKSGVSELKSKIVDLNDPLVSSFMSMTDINGIVLNELYEIKQPTLELINQLTSAGYKIIVIADTYYVDFRKVTEFWNDKNKINNQYNTTDIVNVIGTSKHEIGHYLDLLLGQNFIINNKENNRK